MNLRARVETIERRASPTGLCGFLDPSPEAERERLLHLLKRDAEAVDLVVRMRRDLDSRYRAASEEERERLRCEDPCLRPLKERFDARVEEVRAGAPLKTDDHERVRRMFNGLPPPDWPGAWPPGVAP